MLKLYDLIKEYSSYSDESSDWWNECSEFPADVSIILDDDPLGGQAVSNVPVLLAWDKENIEKAFDAGYKAFFILTSTRSMTEEEAYKCCFNIISNAAMEARRRNLSIQIICRSDSTLRTHYPCETNAIIKALENSGYHVDGEIIFPFFEEGRRYTYNLQQYSMDDDNLLIPVSSTEYSADKTFGFSSSYLPSWIEEKSNGRISGSSVYTFNLDEIRSDWRNISNKLLSCRNFCTAVADSIEYRDLFSIMRAICKLRESGKSYILRTASSGVKAAIFNKGSGLMDDIITENSNILIAVGSHMKRTSEQVEYLLSKANNIRAVVFNQASVLNKEELDRELLRVEKAIYEAIEDGCDVVLETNRNRIDLDDATPEEQLLLTVRISHAFISIVDKVKSHFRYFIAKGGNTSSDIIKYCFHADMALIAGQIERGVPLWVLPDNTSIAIFPGNVGSKDSLLKAYRRLSGKHESDATISQNGAIAGKK